MAAAEEELDKELGAKIDAAALFNTKDQDAQEAEMEKILVIAGVNREDPDLKKRVKKVLKHIYDGNQGAITIQAMNRLSARASKVVKFDIKPQ